MNSRTNNENVIEYERAVTSFGVFTCRKQFWGQDLPKEEQNHAQARYCQIQMGLKGDLVRTESPSPAKVEHKLARFEVPE